MITSQNIPNELTRWRNPLRWDPTQLSAGDSGRSVVSVQTVMKKQLFAVVLVALLASGALADRQEGSSAQSGTSAGVAQEQLPAADAAAVDGGLVSTADGGASSHQAATAGPAAEQVTPVGGQTPTPPPPPAPAVEEAANPFNATQFSRALSAARTWLFLNETRRNVTRALTLLKELAQVVDAVLPPAAHMVRAKLAPLSFVTPATTPTSTQAGGDPTSSSAESDIAGSPAVVVAAADGAAPGPAPLGVQATPGPHEPLHMQAMRWHKTGLHVAASSAFTLTALRAAGVLPVSLPPQGTASTLVDLHRLVLAGSTEAAMAVSDRYFAGYDVPRNCKLGLEFARLAAEQLTAEAEREGRFSPMLAPADLRERHVDARYHSAEDLENSAQVVQMDEDMALRGNVDAQRRMAYRRLMGRGIEADPEGALHDLTVGAAQGDPFAIFNLGYMYVRGFPPVVLQNYTEGRKLFEKAAAKGFAPAYNGLGVLHWNGHGGKVNMTAAVELFKKAVVLNQSDALYNLAVMHLSGFHVDKNQTLAVDMMERAHAHGHWKSAYNLAQIYDTGIEAVKPDCMRAQMWYRIYFRDRSTWSKSLSSASKAFTQGDHWGALLQYLELAEMGSSQAAANAAWMLRQGLGYSGPGFLDLASRLYQRAALKNHTTAAVELGHMVWDASNLGLSYRADPLAAVTWWRKAAALNNSEGTYLLGWAHHHGVGVGTNLTKARELYLQAVQLAGRDHARALAPHLALACLRLDLWLRPLLGPGATGRATAWLKRRLVKVVYAPPPHSAVPPSSALPGAPATGGVPGAQQVHASPAGPRALGSTSLTAHPEPQQQQQQQEQQQERQQQPAGRRRAPLFTELFSKDVYGGAAALDGEEAPPRSMVAAAGAGRGARQRLGSRGREVLHAARHGAAWLSVRLGGVALLLPAWGAGAWHTAQEHEDLLVAVLVGALAGVLFMRQWHLAAHRAEALRRDQGMGSALLLAREEGRRRQGLRGLVPASWGQAASSSAAPATSAPQPPAGEERGGAGATKVQLSSNSGGGSSSADGVTPSLSSGAGASGWRSSAAGEQETGQLGVKGTAVDCLEGPAGPCSMEHWDALCGGDAGVEEEELEEGQGVVPLQRRSPVGHAAMSASAAPHHHHDGAMAAGACREVRAAAAQAVTSQGASGSTVPEAGPEAPGTQAAPQRSTGAVMHVHVQAGPRSGAGTVG